MPLLCIVYGLQYLDSMTLSKIRLMEETTLSYSSIMGLRTDANLTGGQYNWLGSMFYFGSPPHLSISDASRLPSLRIPSKSSNATSPPRKIHGHKHHNLGHRPQLHVRLPQLGPPKGRPHLPRHLRIIHNPRFRSLHLPMVPET